MHIQKIAVMMGILLACLNTSIAQGRKLLPSEKIEAWPMTACASREAMVSYAMLHDGAALLPGSTTPKQIVDRAPACLFMEVKGVVIATVDELLTKDGSGLFFIKKVRIKSVLRNGRWIRLHNPLVMYGYYLSRILLI